MSKDLIYTILGGVSAVALGVKEYIASQTTGEMDISFWVGLAVATFTAVAGFYAKKGE